MTQVSHLQQVQDGATRLRDTVKWIVGGISTVAAGVVVGSPLTSVGMLDWGWRLALAAAGAAVGFVGLGLMVWESMGFLAARLLNFQSLTHETAMPICRQHRIERQLAGLFAPGETGFKAMGALRERLETEKQRADAKRREEIDKELVRLSRREHSAFLAFDFAEIAEGFLTLRRHVFAMAVVMIAGFGVYAWAANPGKDDIALLDNPYIVSLPVNANGVERLHGNLPDACLRAPLQILVLREYRSGNLDGVLLGPDCRLSRVVLRDRGTWIALRR
jgi:hypothetical protein